MKANLFFTSKEQIGSTKKPLAMSKRDKEVIQEAGNGAIIGSQPEIIKYIIAKNAKRKPTDAYADAYGHAKWEWGDLPKTKRELLAISSGVDKDDAKKMAYRMQDLSDILYGSGSNLRSQGMKVVDYLKKYGIVTQKAGQGANIKTDVKWSIQYYTKSLTNKKKNIKRDVIIAPTKTLAINKAKKDTDFDSLISIDLFEESNPASATSQKKLDKGGDLKANDVAIGTWLKHKRTGAKAKVWNVDPKLGKMQLEDAYGNKSNKWYSATDWSKTTAPKKEKTDYGYGQGGTTKGFCYEIGGL